jgi:hypothetical protein
MSTLTNDQIDNMSKAELRAACKARGIKFGRLSLLQQRDALKENKAEPVKAKKEKKEYEPRGKMAQAIDIYVKNKDKARKEIIALFISKAKLTKAGSATYYALIKKRLG